jgi:hypothetical protein
MSKQILLDYLANEQIQYDADIAQKEEFKINLNNAIIQQEASITQFQAQITQADADIATINNDKVLVDELIVIVEASPVSLK